MQTDDALGPLLDEAVRAYDEARRGVFDNEVGPGPHPRTPEQKKLVADLERAEQALKDYRARDFELNQQRGPMD